MTPNEQMMKTMPVTNSARASRLRHSAIPAAASSSTSGKPKKLLSSLTKPRLIRLDSTTSAAIE
jgi:hypothetical protein